MNTEKLYLATPWVPADGRRARPGRLGRSTMVGRVMSANVRDADKPVTHTCQQCGLVFTLPADVTLTRGSRPCGWSH